MLLPRSGPPSPTRRSQSVAGQVVQNVRLLAQASAQHLVGDPALLVIQVSRRLPFRSRMVLGKLLRSAAPVSPELGALGAVMSGQDDTAAEILSRRGGRTLSLGVRLAGEIAILVDRADLIPENAPPATAARAAWARGDLSGAIEILHDAGQGAGRFACRLRSEFDLLQPGYRVNLGAVPRSKLRPSDLVPTGADTGDLRVLHLLTNSLPHTQSGYSLRSHRILTTLRNQGIHSVALTRTGYPVMVGVPCAAGEDVVDGIRYVRTLPDGLPRTQEQRLLAEVEMALRLVEEFRPHILHVTTNYLNALVAQAVSEETGIPWVFEVRGLMEQTWVASRRSDATREVAEASEKTSLIAAKEGELARVADAVVTLSRTMADELVSRGVERSDIVLVPNGVDDSLFEDHLDTAEARRRTSLAELPGFGPEAFLVGAVSALVDYEGYDVLLRAVALLLDDESTPSELREKIGIVLVGDGVSRPGLATLANTLGIEERVHMPGRVHRDQAPRWIEALDVVVIPRRDVAVARAVTPQKPVEAMALKRLVIASDLRALRESVTGADTGTPRALLVPPEDPGAIAAAIVRAWTDPVALTAVREAAHELARERAWPRQVRRYGEIYRSMTTPGEGGTASGE
ncbi:glycosyltransferase [Brachybacterium alimentarium]|uniref:glycosyltransferase n=1 Tax=Brachybacterium alimentarium TaxID=47845 RepID=UPI003FD23356